MPDFSQNYCLVMRYEGADAIVQNLGKRARGSLVKVEGGRLRILQGQGEVVVDEPAREIRITAPHRIAPTMASVDAGGHHWLIDFGKVHKSERLHSPSIGSKIAAASAFGNLKAMKVGKGLRTQFVASLQSQGAASDA
jgi:hypothetical protein